MRLSLREQIFLGYALVITLLMLGLAFAAQQVIVTRLRAALDDRLQERTEVVAKAIISSPVTSSQDYEDLINWLTERQLPYVPAVLRISGSERNVLATFGEIPDPLVPIIERQLLLPEMEEGRFETVRIRGHDALRLYTIPVYDPTTLEVIAFIQTGDSLAQVVEAQEQMWRYTLIVGCAGIILALIAGFFITKRGFRPLERILGHVQVIGRRDLSAGIPEEPRPPELQQLASTLNDMMQRLEKAFKAREVFIASVSHDLRTPLTALQGQIDVLLMEPSLDRISRESLETMAKEVRRLTRMTNNLLLNAQLETSPIFIPAEVDLKELIEEVTTEVRILAEGLELEATIPESAIISGDYDLLKQMLLNVVDNAVKFTPKGGAVQVSLKREKNHAVLEVADTGQGISTEHLQYITEPFYRADSSRRFGSKGIGLGLAIVKQVIDLHGGQLEIQSQQGAGTTVKMRLPLQ